MRDTFDVLRERELDYGDVGAGKGGADRRRVGGGGEDGDGGVAVAEEAGEVEEGDDVTLGEEGEDGEVWGRERTHAFLLL